MRVLHIIARLNVGGTSRYISHLVDELPNHGVEIYLATGYVQGSEIEDTSILSTNILRVPSLGRAINPIRDFVAQKQIKRIIKELKPDIIHSHTFKAGLLVRTIKTDIPFVHTYHGHLLEDPEFSGIKSKLIVLLERRLAKGTSKLVTVGSKVGEDLLNRRIGNTKQYTNIPPGIAPLIITSRLDALRSLGLDRNTSLVVGWIARVTGVKNPMKVLKIARRIPDVHFVMAGGGDLLEKIRSHAPENLTAVGWVRAEDLLGASDIIFLTSENEGMPIALIEAQMAGKPCVATNVGSVEEIIEDGVTGFVTGKSTEEITSSLKILIADKELQYEFSRNAKNRAMRFSISNLIDAHIALYKEILA
jgi:glycosyltransferase involved in cell wall biosynthesis